MDDGKRITQPKKMVIPRFRPIAPKPVAGGSYSSSPPFDNTQILFLSRNFKRSKRKYTRARKNNQSYRRLRKQGFDTTSNNVVTLQLLPEKKTEEKSSLGNLKSRKDDPTGEIDRDPQEGLVSVRDGAPTVVVESWLTLESLSCSCIAEVMRSQLGCTDDERLKRLDGDKCPGFVSDGWNNVRWVNGAYRRMVGVADGKGDGLSQESGMRVWPIVKDGTEDKETVCVRLLCGAFTCRVRVQWKETWRKEKRSMTVPCDAWRMDGGWFAWRLDVEAALCLGRSRLA